MTVFALSGMLFLSTFFGIGCATTTGDGLANDAGRTGSICPVCRTGYSQKEFDQKGKPVKWKSYHICPMCGTQVATVITDGKPAHTCLNHNDKTNTCPSCKGH